MNQKTMKMIKRRKKDMYQKEVKKEMMMNHKMKEDNTKWMMNFKMMMIRRKKDMGQKPVKKGKMIQLSSLKL